LVLHKFEEAYPNDARPRKAIEAAEAWLANPCEETREAAMEAAMEAADAARAHYVAIDAHYVAIDAAYAAIDAAYAAIDAAYASDAAIDAYASASDAASAAIDTNDKEIIKQKIHQFILDDILLGDTIG